MGLVLACMIRVLLDDWSIRLGENRPGRVLKHMAAMFTSNGQHGFSYRGVKAWNNLPTEAKQASSLMQLKKLVLNWII